MYLNKAIVYGNLTRDPELKSLPSGTPVVNFSIATSRTWKDKDGQKKEDTQFHNIVAFGPMARTIAQYLKKGRAALVEGRMQTRSWDAADGQKKYRTEIIADNFQFGPAPAGTSFGGGSGAGSAPAGGQAVAGEMPQSAPAPESEGIQYPTEDINPDDIPF
ncbi:MAG: single-stranded DNA-binding protein [Candidatus Vogelbacteria bacterium]|nr:single-stranded DNA-binding protein [Candidatus Vogelbacteria bacterium]